MIYMITSNSKYLILYLFIGSITGKSPLKSKDAATISTVIPAVIGIAIILGIIVRSRR